MRILCILFFVSLSMGCFSQGDTLIRQTAFKQKGYRKFEKKQCKAENYPDSREAKDLLCRAGYFFSINENRNSLESLKQAFLQGYSVEFKFQVIKLMVDNYKQLGFTQLAKTYQDKLDKVREAFPEVEKRNPAK